MIVDELVTLLSLTVSSSSKKSSNIFSGFITNITSHAKTASIAIAAIEGSAIALNTTTTRFEMLAKSVGFSSGELTAWQGLIASAGFDAETITDLVEEMTNKFGESSGLSEQMIAVKEAMHILGLSFEEVKAMSPEDQFKTIMTATKGLADSAEAAAAADILMGGQANRVVGILRSQEGALDDLLAAQRSYNFLTADGIRGAEESTKAYGNLKKVTSSLAKDIAGKAGHSLALVTNALTNFIIKNQDFIKLGIGNVIDGISKGFNYFADVFSTIFRTISNIIPSFGKFTESLDATRVIGIAVASVLSVISVIAIAASAKFLLIGAAIAGVVIVVEDLFSFFTGGDSLIGSFFQLIAEKVIGFRSIFSDALSSIKDSFQNTFSFILGIIDQVTSAISNITEIISNFFSNGVSKIADFFSSGVGKIADFFDFSPNATTSDLPASVMNSTSSNNNSQTIINQNINTNDARLAADRMAENAGISRIAATSGINFSSKGA